MVDSAQDARNLMRRNVLVLASCQALAGSIMIMNIASAPLVGHMLLGPDKSLATFPLFLMHFAVMGSTVPASFLMKAKGRRFGFALGSLFGVGGGLTGTAAVYLQSFATLCVATILIGAAQGFAFYYRFAAADAAATDYRPRAISLVMAGGVLSALLGPEAAKHTKDLLAPVTFAGIYMMVALFAAAILLLSYGLRIARTQEEGAKGGGRPLAEIARQPAYRVAVLVSMVGYATMTLLMTATPLAMRDCQFSFDDSATVIQVHVLGMFVPSFFTGSLITRFGTTRVIVAGSLIEILAALTNLAGISFGHFAVGLTLLGVGWNFMFIGGTTLLTTTYKPAEKAKAQALNEFLVYASTAIAAGLSGVLQARIAWSLLNLAALPMLCVVLLALTLLWASRRRTARELRVQG